MLIGMFSDQKDGIKISRCEWVETGMSRRKASRPCYSGGEFPDRSNREQHDGGWNRAMNSHYEKRMDSL
jgi:hypothetical protein